MRARKYILFPLLLILAAVSLYAQPADSSYAARAAANSTGHHPDLELYYSQLRKNSCRATDSVMRYLQRVTPIDTLLTNYLERGFGIVHDTLSLMDLVDQGRSIHTPQQRRDYVPELEGIVRKYNSPRLDRFFDFFKSSSISVVHYDQRAAELERVAERCRRAGDDYMEAFTLKEMWNMSYFGQRYARSFFYASKFEEILDHIDDNYPFKASGYFMLGGSYYRFRDYDRAIALFRKGLSYRGTAAGEDPGGFLRAWNHLASWHSMQGNIDSAAYYHRTILGSDESTLCSPIYSAIALGNLGKIEMHKGEIDTATSLMEAALEHLDGSSLDWDFSLGIHIALAECYLTKGDTDTAKRHLDVARKGISNFPESTQQARLKEWYAAQSKYLSRLGNHELADACLDSVLVASRLYNEMTGQHFVLLGEQQLSEAEIQFKTELINKQNTAISSIVIALALLSAALTVIVRLYRRRNAAYKVLAEKANEWARTQSVEESPGGLPDNAPEQCDCGSKEQASDEDHRIMSLIEQEMAQNHTYREAGLTGESLAGRLGIHRNSLSRAVNRCTGANFSQYINSLRIKEAVRLISGTNHSDLRMEELYEQIGFTSYATFYRTFKQFTGLSPAEFQKQETLSARRH